MQFHVSRVSSACSQWPPCQTGPLRTGGGYTGGRGLGSLLFSGPRLKSAGGGGGGGGGVALNAGPGHSFAFSSARLFARSEPVNLYEYPLRSILLPGSLATWPGPLVPVSGPPDCRA